MAKNKSTSLETTLRKLEAVVKKLEDEDIGLEDSLDAFEEGIRLTRSAQEALDVAEQKVQLLLEKNGDPVEQPLSDDE